MKRTSQHSIILPVTKGRRTIAILAYLALFLMLSTKDAFLQSSLSSTRKANARNDADLMDQPPTYSTKSGWVYGNKIGAISKGTSLLIFEERAIGFFGSKQIWFRVKLEKQAGWVNSTNIEERRERQSNLFGRLGTTFIPTALAQSDLKEIKSESYNLGDPVFLGSFVSIVAGMIAKITFDLFRKRRRWLGTKGFALRLLPSLVISPIVFLGFLRTADIRFSDDLSIMVFFLLAFQTGFFWEDVLNMEQVPELKQMTQRSALVSPGGTGHQPG